MKYNLTVAEFHSKPGTQDEIYYTDNTGELFIGLPKNVTINKIYQVEVKRRFGDHYYRIVSWPDN